MEIFSKGLKKDGNFKGDGYISQGGGILEDYKTDWRERSS